MTRKDYKLLVEVFADEDASKRLIETFCEIAKHDNVWFSPQQFREEVETQKEAKPLTR